MSVHSECVLAYRRSRRTISSNVVRLRPLTCQSPVMPGFASSTRRRCHGWYCSTSKGSGGRGPTSDMSPRSTFQNCGSSSRLVLRRNRPDGRDARVVRELEHLVAGARLLPARLDEPGHVVLVDPVARVHVHRPELEHRERLAPSPDADLPEERGARGGPLHRGDRPPATPARRARAARGCRRCRGRAWRRRATGGARCWTNASTSRSTGGRAAPSGPGSIAVRVEADRQGGQGGVAEPPGELAAQAVHHLERPLPGGLRQQQSQHGVLFEPAHGVHVALHGRDGAQDRGPGRRCPASASPRSTQQHRERRVEPVGALSLPDERVLEQRLAEDRTRPRAPTPGRRTPAGRSGRVRGLRARGLRRRGDAAEDGGGSRVAVSYRVREPLRSQLRRRARAGCGRPSTAAAAGALRRPAAR